MRLIRPAGTSGEHQWALALSLGMLLVGLLAILLMAMVPEGHVSGVAMLVIPPVLGLGVGLAWLIRALSSVRRRPVGDDLARLLGPSFDDSYVLIVSPLLPGVPDGLSALLVGPAGVRALTSRQWRGRYRVRGRSWDYDTKSEDGWVPCRTNPSFEADSVAHAVAAWARTALDEPALPIVPAVVFPRPWSVIVLEEPDGEIVTSDNAPWWAQRIGRLQRMDAPRVAHFVQSVIDAADGAQGRAPAPVPQSLA